MSRYAHLSAVGAGRHLPGGHFSTTGEERHNEGQGGQGDNEEGSMNENQRRLRAAGYLFEPSPAGKHFWRQPGTERLIPEDRAFELVRREEVRRLEEAGWRQVEIEGDTYWRRPGSRYLYPRGAAYNVVMHSEKGDEEVPPA
jgi:hypothetical protein